MQSPTTQQWAAHLRRIAGAAATNEVKLGLGTLEPPFRAAVLGEQTSPTPAQYPPGDAGLWWALVDDRVHVDDLIQAETDGSLFPQGLYKAIEVWTEADLCGLHALWRLARERGRHDWRARLEAVRDWHLANTEPGNATNRPWALHVFLLSGTFEGQHYAETLLHNCMSMDGVPDPLSAWILIDAARELEYVASES